MGMISPPCAKALRDRLGCVLLPSPLAVILRSQRSVLATKDLVWVGLSTSPGEVPRE